jgi:1,4-dihydroxy-2-naphthoyl-CoA hydrolase
MNTTAPENELCLSAPWWSPLERYTPEYLNGLYNLNPIKKLGFEYLRAAEFGLVGRLPVTEDVKQFFGFVHGTTYCALTEEFGSIATMMCIDFYKDTVLGSNNNTSFLRPVSEGEIVGLCRLVHRDENRFIWRTDMFTGGDFARIDFTRADPLTVAFNTATEGLPLKPVAVGLLKVAVKPRKHLGLEIREPCRS